MDQDPTFEPFGKALEQKEDDLPREAVEAARRRSRINALVLGAAFLLMTVAPRPWNSYAPILFLVPVIYSLVSRMRRSSSLPGPSSSRSVPSQRADSRRVEPYSCTPRDRKDPRKYKPIG